MSKDKVRLYQLAHDLGVESKDLIDLLQAAGADVKSHMTAIDPETRKLAEDLISGKVKPDKARQQAASAPAAPGPAPTAEAAGGAEIPAPKSRRLTEIPKVKGSEKPASEAKPAETPAPTEEKPAAPPPLVAVEPPPPVKTQEPIPPPTPPVAAAEPITPSAPTVVAKSEEPPKSPPPVEVSAEKEPEDSSEPPKPPKAAEPPKAPAQPARPIPPPKPIGPIPTGGRQIMTMPPSGGSGASGQKTQRSGKPRPQAPSGPRFMSMPPAAPPVARAKPEAQKKVESAQKPVMKLAEAIKTGRIGQATPVDTLAVTPDLLAETEEERIGRHKGGAAMSGREERQRRRQRVVARSDDDEDEDSQSSARRALRNRQRRQQMLAAAAAAKGPAVVELPLTVRSFCEATGVAAKEVLRKIMNMGSMATINSALGEEQAHEIALELGVEIEIRRPKDAETLLQEKIGASEDSEEQLVLRPPVVTFMGHVDHGKTSLMDRIRSARVAAGEAGGITQHIGAYQVQLPDGRGKITFLDTPGHEAFTAMRARGASITDIVVLVVAADDGVMPQTEEAISHAKAAGVSIIVAMNKIDLPNANTDRIKQQLASHGLLPEEWQGDTLMVPTSATTGKGIDELLQSLVLIAELKELKANPNRSATGTCIEASLSDERGVQCTLLVRNGTLKRGDMVLCGQSYGRVRAMYDEAGRTVETAGPSTPVLITGLDSVPAAGDTFVVVVDAVLARQISEARRSKAVSDSQVAREHVTLEKLFDSLQKKKTQDLFIILKADVRGSLEAIKKEITKLKHDEVSVKVIHEGVGGISESDVMLADASDAIIVGFHVAPDDRAISLASEKAVEIRRYDIIYQVTDDIKKALEGLLVPEKREVQLGRCVVQKLFTISRLGTIAGCRVVSGTIERSGRIRIIRDGTIIGNYAIETLKRHKDDARDVREGLECGLKLANFNDIKMGDVFEAYRTEEIKRTL